MVPSFKDTVLGQPLVEADLLPRFYSCIHTVIFLTGGSLFLSNLDWNNRVDIERESTMSTVMMLSSLLPSGLLWLASLQGDELDRLVLMFTHRPVAE